MTGDKRDETQGGGVAISSGRSTTVGGDVVGGDKETHDSSITVSGVGTGAAVAAGSGASASVTQAAIEASDLAAILTQWQAQMEAEIDAHPDLSAEDKQDLKETVGKIHQEAAKGEQTDVSRLEKLINTLAVMGPDIFEVAVTTLMNPLAGIGLVIQKIGDKAKLEPGEVAP
jgi:hypothetical protein